MLLSINIVNIYKAHVLQATRWNDELMFTALIALFSDKEVHVFTETALKKLLYTTRSKNLQYTIHSKNLLYTPHFKKGDMDCISSIFIILL